jgi:hypothetical protein
VRSLLALLVQKYHYQSARTHSRLLVDEGLRELGLNPAFPPASEKRLMGGYAVYTLECHADACDTLGGERVLGGSCNRVLQLERASGGGGAGGAGGAGSVAPEQVGGEGAGSVAPEQVGGGGTGSAAAVAAAADPPAAEVRSLLALLVQKDKY